MQEQATVSAGQQAQTVTAALGDILGLCGRLESLAGEILWRVKGHRSSPPDDAPESVPQAVGHRFIQDATDAVNRLNELEKTLGEVTGEFDRNFGV